MNILVTAFNPFGPDSVNPSEQVLERLPATIASEGPEAGRLIKVVLPTEFAAATAAVRAAIDEHHPDVVLSLGQAGGRRGLTIERVAINVQDASIADNAGHEPIDEPIAPDGPAAYFSTLPIKAVAAAIRDEGIAASVSNTAGTFVCNAVMYAALHHVATTGTATSTVLGTLTARAGFIHVPFVPEQTAERPDAPAMELETIARGVEIAIETIIATAPGQDATRAEGATH